MEDMYQMKDSNYQKKNKPLCIYCSYRVAVPSKMNEYCSELCRLLHFSITKKIDIDDIAKLIKLNKVDLINIILTLKQISISKKEICEACDVKYEPPQLFSIKQNTEGHKISFD